MSARASFALHREKALTPLKSASSIWPCSIALRTLAFKVSSLCGHQLGPNINVLINGSLRQFIVTVYKIPVIASVVIIRGLLHACQLEPRHTAPGTSSLIQVEKKSSVGKRDYQCFHFQLPWSWISVQVPNLRSPLGIMVFSFLHWVSLQIDLPVLAHSELRSLGSGWPHAHKTRHGA